MAMPKKIDEQHGPDAPLTTSEIAPPGTAFALRATSFNTSAEAGVDRVIRVHGYAISDGCPGSYRQVSLPFVRFMLRERVRRTESTGQASGCPLTAGLTS